MGDLGEIPIATSFTRPKMEAVFFSFFGIVSEVIRAKTEDDDFANFKVEVFAR
jgi:intracellular septation protein A